MPTILLPALMLEVPPIWDWVCKPLRRFLVNGPWYDPEGPWPEREGKSIMEPACEDGIMLMAWEDVGIVTTGIPAHFPSEFALCCSSCDAWPCIAVDVDKWDNGGNPWWRLAASGWLYVKRDKGDGYTGFEIGATADTSMGCCWEEDVDTCLEDITFKCDARDVCNVEEFECADVGTVTPLDAGVMLWDPELLRELDELFTAPFVFFSTRSLAGRLLCFDLEESRSGSESVLESLVRAVYLRFWELLVLAIAPAKLDAPGVPDVVWWCKEVEVDGWWAVLVGIRGEVNLEREFGAPLALG